MEPTEGTEQSYNPLQGEGTENEATAQEITEGLASMRWQREGGRMSRREGSRQSSTPLRVNAMSSATGGQMPGGRGDFDGETSGEEGETRQQARRTSEVGRDEHPVPSEADAQNQHDGTSRQLQNGTTSRKINHFEN